MRIEFKIAAALWAAALTGCFSTQVGHTGLVTLDHHPPVRYERLGAVIGQDCHLEWKLGEAPDLSLAIADALKKKAGADALVHADWTWTGKFYVLFNGYCLRVQGEAVKMLGEGE